MFRPAEKKQARLVKFIPILFIGTGCYMNYAAKINCRARDIMTLPLFMYFDLCWAQHTFKLPAISRYNLTMNDCRSFILACSQALLIIMPTTTK